MPEWAGWVHTHKDLMADELHPGPEGANDRAQLIAQGILGCLAAAATSSAPPPPRQERSLEPRLAPVDAIQKSTAERGRRRSAWRSAGSLPPRSPASPILTVILSAAPTE